MNFCENYDKRQMNESFCMVSGTFERFYPVFALLSFAHPKVSQNERRHSFIDKRRNWE